MYPSSSSLPPGHSHPMDMPGRGLYDERDSGIARSGRLMRLGAQSLDWPTLNTAFSPTAELWIGFIFILVKTKLVKVQRRSSVGKLLDYRTSESLVYPPFHLKHITGSHKCFYLWLSTFRLPKSWVMQLMTLFFQALPGSKWSTCFYFIVQDQEHGQLRQHWLL